MDYMEYLYELYKGTKRQGPGTDAATMKALSMIDLPPDGARVLDVGCGTGTQTIEIMLSTGCEMTAVDIFDGFLEELRKKAAARGLENKLKAMNADMRKLPFENESFDCIWSEGAVYIMGFENGLREWRRLIRNNGYLVVSEISYIKQDVPPEPAVYWKENYPFMGYTEDNIAAAERCGYEVIGTFVLGKEAWYEFYAETSAKLAEFKNKFHDDTAKKVTDETEKEIQLYTEYGEYYSYVFYILKKI